MIPAIRCIPHETTAEAHGPCKVNKIQNEDFLAFLFRHRTVCWRAMQILADLNRELLLNARRVALSGSVAGNVAKLLLDWEATVSDNNGKKHFNMLLTHREIAEIVGATRETVTRALASFRQKGWISVHGASVEILQREKLKHISI